jgi:hypothetical protein
MTRRHFTAWMANSSSVVDQPNMDIAIIEDQLLGEDPDNVDHWSSDSSKPQPFYAPRGGEHVSHPRHPKKPKRPR